MGTRNFHWDPIDDCVMQETDETGSTLVTYTHEPGQFGPLLSENRGGTESYHHYDALGSTTMLTNDAGTVTDTFLYDAWGTSVARTGTTATPYQWIGRWGGQSDIPTGEIYVRTRDYQSPLARWSSIASMGALADIRSIPMRALSYSITNPTDSADFLFNSPASLATALIPAMVSPLSILPMNPSTQRCRKLSIDWKIAAQQLAGVKYVLIVQKLENTRYKQTCSLQLNQGNLCCVYKDDACRGGCTVYELLGVIAFQRQEEIINNNLINVNSLIDGWRFPSIAPPCTEKGSKDIEADVRGFEDNFLLLFNQILNKENGWKPPGSEPCDCPDETETGFGFHKLGNAPTWWNANRYEGSNFATVDYSCCLSPRNTLSYGSNSTSVNEISN